MFCKITKLLMLWVRLYSDQQITSQQKSQMYILGHNLSTGCIFCNEYLVGTRLKDLKIKTNKRKLVR